MTNQEQKTIREIIPGCSVTTTGELISPNGETYNHIESVNVLIGQDDDYCFDERWEFTAEKAGLNKVEKVKHPFRYRLRGEPAVVMTIQEEGANGSSEKWRLVISHHKGNINIDTERLK